jgi:GT2 family glycosyltransferase
MTPHGIAFITCVNDETQYGICLRYLDALLIPLGHTVERIAVFGAMSMADGYQWGMEASTARYKIYVHQDVYIVYQEQLPDLLHLFSAYPRIGMFSIIGATQFPASGKWWERNRSNCYGRTLHFVRPPQGFPASFFVAPNLRRLRMYRLQSFVGDYMPAVVVDGLLLATQYDVPWKDPLGGFELWEQVQSVEFIKAGLEVGIARQQAIWCVHWGPIREHFAPRGIRRQTTVDNRAEVFRQLYPTFLGVPAQKLYEQHRRGVEGPAAISGNFDDRAVGMPVIPPNAQRPDPAPERLGVLIGTVTSQEALVRALRSVMLELETVQGADYQVVVVAPAATDGLAEMVRREFPRVTAMTVPSDSPARRFNAGLRSLGFPGYVLVMQDAVEFSPGTLDKMVSYLREHPSTAGVVPCFIRPDKTVQHQRLTIVQPGRRKPRRLQSVTFVGTTCALVRGNVFFDVGLYDDRYNCDADLDWSLRAKRKGYTFALLPHAGVMNHQIEASVLSLRVMTAQRFVARLWFAYKHGGRRWAGVVFWAQSPFVRWAAFRWRNEAEALHQLNEAVVQMDDLHRRIRSEDRLPRLLGPE